MDTPSSRSRQYSSPPHALIWSFRKSRDNWKRKYLDVKADLKRARRRLDRLDRVKPSSPGPTAEAATTTASCSTAALGAFLSKELLDLRQQLQVNRELLEQGQEQTRLLVELTQRLQSLVQAASPLEQPDAPLPAQPPRQPLQADTPPPLRPFSHQAPAEPKKGAPRYHGH